MRRVTHTLLGAAVALPIAVSHDTAVAIGCVWWGMAGGGFPDWFDLRSEFRSSLRLRHRGASHGLPFVAMACLGLLGLLRAIGASAFAPGGVALYPGGATILPWVACFMLGMLSHLASDSCTVSGIQPLLPFGRWRFWLVPRPLRSRSDGYLDKVLGVVAVCVLTFGLVTYISRFAW